MSGGPAHTSSPSGIWLPLKSFPHGRVVRNNITTQETRTTNPHSIDLWWGSEVYAFEVFVDDVEGAEETETWLRGYILGNPSLTFYPPPPNSTKDHPAPPRPPEPAVFIGIFPWSCIAWDHPIRAQRPDAASRSTHFEFSYEPNELRGTLGPPVPIPNRRPLDGGPAGEDEDDLLLLIRETVERWVSLLPGLLTNRDYKSYHQSTKDVRWAVSAYRQLGSMILTRAQRKRLKRDVIRRLSAGDERLGLGVVVRHPETGRLPVVTQSQPEAMGEWKITPLRLYLAEAGLKTLIRNQGKSSKEEERLAELYLNDPGRGIPSIHTIRSTIRSPSTEEKNRDQARFLAQVKATIIPTSPGESLELSLSVYDDSETKRAFVTEEFMYQAMAGGHIADKASVVFDLPSTQGDSLFLVIKVVRVVESGGVAGWRRYPFGIAVAPLRNVVISTGQQQEKVLSVVPWTQEKVFASMHEELVGPNSVKDINKHRIVIGMQMISHSQTTRHAAIARSLSGPNPSPDFADVYIKLWSAVLPEPIPDEVYVKMTLYSADQHRLVDCLFPGGSGTAAEGDLEYKSILWQKSPGARRPIFGDLVRFRVSRDMLETGFIRFSLMAVEKGTQGVPENGGDETILFNVELPLCRTPRQALWLEDGEHTLIPSEPGYVLTVRSLALIPFGFKDPNIAYVLQQSPNDISMDRVALLTYAPADELERHASRLVDYLLLAILGDATNSGLHSAVLDVLVRVAGTLGNETDRVLASETAQRRERVAHLVLEAMFAALRDPAKRNVIIKTIGPLLGMTRRLSANSDATNVTQATDIIQLELIAIASAKDDPIGHTLVLKHWPFSSFLASEDAIKLIDYSRANTVAEQKAKLGFMMRTLDELSPEDSLMAALWRNTKGLLKNADRDRSEVLQLSVSLIARMVDRIILAEKSLGDVLEYFGLEVLQSLFVLFDMLEAWSSQGDHFSELPIASRLALQATQQPEHVRLSLVVSDTRGCIVGITNAMHPRLKDLLTDFEEEEATNLRDAAWRFFEAVCKESHRASLAELFPCVEKATWLGLCRAICQRKWSAESSPMSIAPVIALIGQCPPSDGPCRHLTAEVESDAVASLEYVQQNHITPRFFTQMVDLALCSTSSKIRQVCHRAILDISFGGPNVEIEAFLLLLVQAFGIGAHRITQITMLVQEASTIWLTEENGWGQALEILPLLYDALEGTSCIQPLHGLAYLALLDLVIPFPAVKKALVERLYAQVFECEGASTANLMLDLALLCLNPDESFSLRLHGHTSAVKVRVAELHDAAVNEAIHASDMGLAARILASLTVVAEREGDYHRMSQVLTCRSKLAREMQESSPVWRYFHVRCSRDEPVEIIWRAKTCAELLGQIQQAFPQSHIGLRERLDHTPIPTETEVIIHEVDIEDALTTGAPTPTRPLWAKHDNLTRFTRDLPDGDLEIYTIDPAFPSIFPFSTIRSTNRVVQTEEEVIARKIRARMEEFQVGLNRVMGADDCNGLSDLLDASIDDRLILTHLNAGYETLIPPYLSLLDRGLAAHHRLTQGTPLEGFHESLVERYEGRFPDVLRERANGGGRGEKREGAGLLGLVFEGISGQGGAERIRAREGGAGQGDRPSEETLVDGRMGMRSPTALSLARGLRGGYDQRSSGSSMVLVRSPTRIEDAVSPHHTSPRMNEIKSWNSYDGGMNDAGKPGSTASTSRRLPSGLKRLGSMLGAKRRRESESSTVG